MRRLVAIMFGLLSFSAPAQAHPPSSVEIDYVSSEGRLYVYMDHLSRDHRGHYIRRTAISINGREVKSESNRQQIDPNAYAFSVDLEAKENDEITVKAYCAEGGVAEAAIVVPAVKKGQEPVSAVKAKVEDYKNRDRAVDVYDSKSEVY